LIKKGHKRIGFIKGPESMTSTDERLQGYIQSLEKNAIKFDRNLIVETDLTPRQNISAIKRLINATEGATAVVVFNDYVAFDAIKYARETGHDNISFASYGNIPMSHYLDHPPVVSIEQFPGQQAEKATEILLQLIDAKDAPTNISTKIVLEGKLAVHAEGN
ncbi:MAG TPA: substrate-binding domain-containing protein, partial [Chitinophagaceae bacterium]|nr:substrate-binding domain-containing protein [Chitinophagaceae bacterium]